MSQRGPFKAVYDASQEQLVMSGDLTDSAETLAALDAFAAAFDKYGCERLLIVTDEMWVAPPDGLAHWFKILNTTLKDCKLFYKCGDITLKLEYDERHVHPQTILFGRLGVEH